MKIFLLIFISATLTASKDFQSKLDEWSTNMDFQRFEAAEKYYLDIREICKDYLDIKMKIECQVVDILHIVFNPLNISELSDKKTNRKNF